MRWRRNWSERPARPKARQLTADEQQQLLNKMTGEIAHSPVLSAFGVQVRAGLHCSPNIHRAMGTFESGGTVRFSLGPFNTADEVNAAIEAVRQIAAGS